MGVITEQTQCSAGPCWLCASKRKGSVFSLQNLFLQGTGRGCQHLRLRHIEYEFPAHKDFIIHPRLWFSSPSTLALLSGSRGSDQICHWQDHLGRKSAGRISTRSLPRSPPLHACSPPPGWGFTTHRSAAAPSSSSAKVMAGIKRKQNKEDTSPSDKRASYNEQILFQSRWEKIRGARLSVSSAWRDGGWKQPLKQPREAGGRAHGNTSSTACTLLLAVTLLGGAPARPKVDGLYLTMALAVRGSRQGCDEFSGERRTSPHLVLPGCTSDFMAISLTELGLPAFTCLSLRSWPPVSAPFPHSLCI